MSEAERLLRSAYRAFNARDVEAAIELMDPEVDWPNAWEGGRVVGRTAVRDYWNRQFAAISGEVEPEGFTEEADPTLLLAQRSSQRGMLSGQVIVAALAKPCGWLPSTCSAALTVPCTAGGRPISSAEWPHTVPAPPAATRAAADRLSSRL